MRTWSVTRYGSSTRLRKRTCLVFPHYPPFSAYTKVNDPVKDNSLNFHQRIQKQGKYFFGCVPGNHASWYCFAPLTILTFSHSTVNGAKGYGLLYFHSLRPTEPMAYPWDDIESFLRATVSITLTVLNMWGHKVTVCYTVHDAFPICSDTRGIGDQVSVDKTLFRTDTCTSGSFTW